MDVDRMEAGRELDALIAEKVMGWKWFLLLGAIVKHYGKIEIPMSEIYDGLPVEFYYKTSPLAITLTLKE